MTKRIEELIDQACDDLTNHHVNPYVRDSEFVVVKCGANTQGFAFKFADLIIQECIKACKERHTYGTMGAEDAIKEYFGMNNQGDHDESHRQTDS